MSHDPQATRLPLRAKYSSMRRSAQAATRFALTTAVVAPVAAVGVIYAIDRVRKSRVPGGHPGFPTVAPKPIDVGNNVISAYTEGRSLYEEMIREIDAAQDHVYFETYVWRSDEIGMKFKDALVRAAERGVDVFIIYDGFGSFLSSPKLKVFKRTEHLYVHRVREVRMGLLLGDVRRTGRNHRKVLVVDDKIGFVGGFNIGEDFGKEWRDTHIEIVGPAVKILAGGFREFWNTFRAKNQPRLQEGEQLPWNDQIDVAFNLPSHLLFPVRQQYLDAFRRAGKSIELTTAYFVPDNEILRELILAERRGVQVRVLIPEYSNHILADWVARPFYGQLLKEGVEIWLYKHAMIHAKTVIADGYRSIVGTANVDRLSMMGNFEVTVRIDSEEFAEQLEHIFENDLTTARKLTLEEWENRTLLTRILEKLVQPFSFVV